MENDSSFFKEHFEHYDFGYPYNIGYEAKVKLFEIFVDYFKNGNEKSTRQKVINLLGKKI